MIIHGSILLMDLVPPSAHEENLPHLRFDGKEHTQSCMRNRSSLRLDDRRWKRDHRFLLGNLFHFPIQFIFLFGITIPVNMGFKNQTTRICFKILDLQQLFGICMLLCPNMGYTKKHPQIDQIAILIFLTERYGEIWREWWNMMKHWDFAEVHFQTLAWLDILQIASPYSCHVPPWPASSHDWPGDWGTVVRTVAWPPFTGCNPPHQPPRDGDQLLAWYRLWWCALQNVCKFGQGHHVQDRSCRVRTICIHLYDVNLGDRLTMFETCSIAAVPFHSARTTFFPGCWGDGKCSALMDCTCCILWVLRSHQETCDNVAFSTCQQGWWHEHVMMSDLFNYV